MYSSIVQCKQLTTTYCYDLKLELRLHLDKDLREVKGDV